MSNNNTSSHTIKPDFDTEVLWRPRAVRTMSTSSDTSIPDEGRVRRASITEMFMGPRVKLINVQRQSSTSSEDAAADMASSPDQHISITESRDFKEFMRRQRRILEDR